MTHCQICQLCQLHFTTTVHRTPITQVACSMEFNGMYCPRCGSDELALFQEDTGEGTYTEDTGGVG